MPEGMGALRAYRREPLAPSASLDHAGVQLTRRRESQLLHVIESAPPLASALDDSQALWRTHDVREVGVLVVQRTVVDPVVPSQLPAVEDDAFGPAANGDAGEVPAPFGGRCGNRSSHRPGARPGHSPPPEPLPPLVGIRRPLPYRRAARDGVGRGTYADARERYGKRARPWADYSRAWTPGDRKSNRTIAKSLSRHRCAMRR